MSKAKDRSAFWFICLCILLTVLALRAEASGDCRDGSCNEVILSGGDNTANNSVLNEGSRAYAFSHSLGDVDINDCLASTQWGTILVSRQNVKLNRWCAAEIYDHKGMYQMAALMRCGIREIAEHFQTESECIEANTVEVSRGTPETSHEEPDLTPILSRLSELESRNSELQAEYDALEQRRQRAARLAREEDERARKRAQDALSALEAYE